MARRYAPAEAGRVTTSHAVVPSPFPLPPGVGVDGCRGGWVAAILIDGHLRAMRRAGNFAGLLAAVDAVLDAHPHAGAHAPQAAAGEPVPILVDMPMGLTWDGRRGLEERLRRELPVGRKSSVFPVPSRAVLDAVSYRDACDRNAAACGRRVTQQTWHILHKVRELDACLRADARARARCVESHPEACFHLLAQSAPAPTFAAGRDSPSLPAPESGNVLPPKRGRAGRDARLALLERLGVGGAARWKQLLADDHAGVAVDDALDAICLAFVGSQPSGWRVLQDPARPVDELGLPLRLVLPALPPSPA